MNRSIYFSAKLEKEIIKRAKIKKVSVSKIVCELLEKAIAE